jgi:hypothetical protein
VRACVCVCRVCEFSITARMASHAHDTLHAISSHTLKAPTPESACVLCGLREDLPPRVSSRSRDVEAVLPGMLCLWRTQRESAHSLTTFNYPICASACHATLDGPNGRDRS